MPLAQSSLEVHASSLQDAAIAALPEEPEDHAMVVELEDDSIFEQLAEASVEPLVDGASEEASAARAASVAVAKSRLAKVRLVTKAIKKPARRLA